MLSLSQDQSWRPVSVIPFINVSGDDPLAHFMITGRSILEEIVSSLFMSVLTGAPPGYFFRGNVIRVIRSVSMSRGLIYNLCI